MPKTRTYVQEASRLAEKRADGTYRVVLITEGTGSTGVYSAELMDSSVHVFENAPSYMDHPIDPEHPERRPVLSIGGRFSNVEAEDGEHGRQLAADFKPREEFRPLFEEFGDVLGLSIFCGAYGEKDQSGRVVVEAFDDTDPYRSVDIVVAAGRGGRFKRAQESLRTIESSLGIPEGNQPGSTSAPDSTNLQENTMDPKALAEALVPLLADALKPMTDFLAEEGARRQAEADAAAQTPEVKDAVEAAITSVEAIKAAKVLPSFETKLIESAKTGADVTADLEFAKTVTAEAKGPKAPEAFPSSYVHESATGASADDDFSLNLGGR
ncbi:MAG: hypothetical protein K0Q52_96 [Microbacterium sp.]|jgi:hypothetical protein|nr:hypothetical protein [Microbacterium sp.]